MSIIRAEWKRFFARRFIRIMFGIIFVLLAIIVIGSGRGSHRITPADHVRAQQEMAQDLAQQKTLIANCETAQAAGQPDPNTQQIMPESISCSDYYGGGDPPQERFYLPDTWTFADQGEDMIVIFGGLLALFGFATGASFIGAEWNSGGMMNLLLWRPRRLTLLSQKLGALLLCVLASSLTLALAFAAMIWALVSTRGVMGKVTSGMWQSLALTGARSVGLVLAATAIGFALASIGRHTATALGVAIGYVIVIEAGGLVAFNALHIVRPERFLLSRYVVAWLFKDQHFYGAQVCTEQTPGNFFCGNGHEWVMRMGSAAEVGGIIIGVLLVWAFISFRRRDVT